MKILFFGDIIGRVARNYLIENLARIKADLAADFVIANAENAAHGYGLTPLVAGKILAAPIDVLTLGDHTWDHENIRESLRGEERILRPENWLKFPEGSGHRLYKCGRARVLVINLLGTLFIAREKVENPFTVVSKILEQYTLGKNADAIFVDFHAEATSEKVSMANMLDGRVSAVIGTHTHVPTADERVLARGTAFMTDAGMCGDFDSSIGMDKGVSMRRFMGAEDEKLAPAEGAPTLCGVLVEIGRSGLATSIRRVMYGRILND
ncbi:MAG: YmdB family metallophosphoesterase [Rickettsiales bacterium]|jgi:metallophosphoesterase (TIGR00282 family)|nr:YmdB family metallophosphoesterase [Rickettsiales bacterium]